MTEKTLIYDNGIPVTYDLHFVDIAFYCASFSQKAHRNRVVIPVETDNGLVAHRGCGDSGSFIAVQGHRIQERQTVLEFSDDPWYHSAVKQQNNFR